MRRILRRTAARSAWPRDSKLIPAQQQRRPTRDRGIAQQRLCAQEQRVVKERPFSRNARRGTSLSQNFCTGVQQIGVQSYPNRQLNATWYNDNVCCPTGHRQSVLAMFSNRSGNSLARDGQTCSLEPQPIYVGQRLTNPPSSTCFVTPNVAQECASALCAQARDPSHHSARQFHSSV